MDSKTLPNLETREEIQSYLLGVAADVGVSLEDPRAAEELDKRDQLAHFRKKFAVPTIGQLLDEDERDKCVDTNQDSIYFSGHSLGLQPLNAAAGVDEEMRKWQSRALLGHWHGKTPWYPIESILSEQSAKVVGCMPEEVTSMNTLTVNIHFAFASFYRPTKERYKVMIEDNCFPSDLFAVQSQVRWHGYNPNEAIIKVSPREGELLWRTEDIVKLIEDHGSSLALVYFSGIHYATGHLFDIQAITQAAHKQGVCAGFDLAHAAGNVELHLHDWEVDFALWCSYKYMNSGPGGIAGFYIHEKHGNNPELPRLLGWWSHNRDTRLDMGKEFDLVLGARGFHVSNPPVLQCILHKASLDVFAQTSISQLRAKSRILTGYLEMFIERNFSKERTESKGVNRYVTIVTSRDPTQRGCQLSLQFSWPVGHIHNFLARRGAVCDLREPSLMRVAPTPLYNSFTDVQRFYALLDEAVNHPDLAAQKQ